MKEKRYTCIVVEDEAEHASLLEEYIEDIPMLAHLNTYDGTTEASINIEKLKPDLVFLDINISGLEGPDFMELVEHKPKIIVISSHPKSKMKEYNIKYHAFIQKPYTKAWLRDVLIRVVNS